MPVLTIEHIESTPDVLGGKPRIAGHRIAVQTIVVFYKEGWDVAAIAEELDISPAQVHAALSYYYDHVAEIEQSLHEDSERIRQSATAVRDVIKKQ